MSFAADLQRARVAIINETDETRQTLTEELFGSIIFTTPVDTGRARGNWQTTPNFPAQGTIDRIDPNNNLATDEMKKAVKESPPDGTLYLTNNLPYIEPLENGHSGQAPAGMVRKNIARIDQILKEKVST